MLVNHLNLGIPKFQTNLDSVGNCRSGETWQWTTFIHFPFIDDLTINISIGDFPAIDHLQGLPRWLFLGPIEQPPFPARYLFKTNSQGSFTAKHLEAVEGNWWQVGSFEYVIPCNPINPVRFHFLYRKYRPPRCTI